MLPASPFPYLIISDANAREYSGTAPAARLNGYLGWQEPGRRHGFAASRPMGPTIPRSEWTARIAAGQGSFLSDLVKQRGIQSKDQNGLNYCWVYGSTRAVELVRAVMGLPTLDLSPESVGGPCTRWRNRGGYASQAFEQLQSGGACEASFMNAPHSLQPMLWKSGWQDNAQLHEAVQWYDLENTDASPIFEEVITCLLNRIPVAAGLVWWGHLVCFLDAVILPPGTAPANTPDGATVGVLFQNSWNGDWPTPQANGLACLTENRATPDGAAAPVVVTAS